MCCGCDRVAANRQERACAMTRPRQGMPCSCLFHLMRQSQALIDSIYLALTLICQDAARQTASGPMESVSQLQNVFHFFLCRNKGVQTCIHSSSNRSRMLSRLHVSFTRPVWEYFPSKVADVGPCLWKGVQGLFFRIFLVKVLTCGSLTFFYACLASRGCHICAPENIKT